MKVLVTGGGGFVGRNLVAALLERGDTVVVLARGEYPALAAKGVTLVRGDVTDVHACLKACEGAEAVFHVAALASVSVRLEPYVRTNIDGTRTLLGAAKAAGVRRFVYTSTPSVVFSPTGHVGSNEAEPLTTQTMSPYAFTKARAEELVLAANEPAFRTLALRPHLVWGPGDTQLTAKLVERARRGRLRLVGDGHEKVDTTYIGNCVDAHLLAERALEQGRGAGKAFFISNGEPLAVRDFVAKVLEAYGVQATARSVPMWLAYGLGAVLEAAHRLSGSDAEPMMTRFMALNLATPHWFDLSAARNDLGYSPRITNDAGFEALRAHVMAAKP